MEFYITNIYPWLKNASLYSALIPFIVGLWLIKSQKDIKFKLLFLFVIISILTEAAALITVLLGTKNNLWLAHLYTLFGFSVLASIFYYSFDKLLLKRAIIMGVVGLCGFIYYDAFIVDGLMKMNSSSRLAANAMLIMMAIAYFYKIVNNTKVIYLDRDPMFLLSCTILIYYAGTSMASALFNQALEVSYDAARICLSVIFVLNVLFNAGQGLVLKKMAA